ncbi:MAG TPA: diacylglycerol kinase family protein [Bryobacteraceae bacterium]|nr:diacylglycerol kinase family protein [Bryobacteraceae bacterium]
MDVTGRVYLILAAGTSRSGIKKKALRYTENIAPYRQPVLIYNPTAGKFRKNPQYYLERTLAALEQCKLRAEPVPTKGPGDATAIARAAAASGADLILVLGGDGTINEAVNGMIHSASALAILPGGTANVLAVELGLGWRLGPAIQRLPQCVEERVAAGRLCGREQCRYFLAMGGAGLDAKIVHDLNPALKRRAGKLAYWMCGFAHIAERVGQFEARINGGVYRCGFALASRVRNYGGDLELARGASLRRDDFEVVLFEGSHPLRYLGYMMAAGVRRVQKMPGVRTAHASSVELTGDVHVQVDGEYAGRTPARFEIVPAALTLLIPPAYG